MKNDQSIMGTQLAEEILFSLQQASEDMIAFLKSLVLEETPSGNASSHDRIFRMLEKRLAVLDFLTLRMPGRKTGGYLYARSNRRSKNQAIQMLVGHSDTVWELGTIDRMPFQEKVDILAGPGIYDMKAGLTQIVFALETIRKLELDINLAPVVLINSDEEIGSHESRHAIIRLARIASRAFILEPPLGLDGKLKTARKGIGRFTLKVKGKAAHAGLDPGKGVNAIVELSHQVQKLFALNDPEKGISVNVGMIEGGISANVVAPISTAIVDVRVLNRKDGEWVTKKILGLKPSMPGSELLIEGNIGRQPMQPTSRNRKLWQLAKNTGELLGLKLEEATAGGGSDGNTTSLYTATLDGLGTTGDGAHAEHEFILSDKLIERTALLTMLLLAN